MKNKNYLTSLGLGICFGVIGGLIAETILETHNGLIVGMIAGMVSAVTFNFMQEQKTQEQKNDRR